MSIFSCPFYLPFSSDYLSLLEFPPSLCKCFTENFSSCLRVLVCFFFVFCFANAHKHSSLFVFFRQTAENKESAQAAELIRRKYSTCLERNRRSLPLRLLVPDTEHLKKGFLSLYIGGHSLCQVIWPHRKINK